MLAGTGLAQEPAGRKLYPVDESHLDPSFAEFKAKFLEAIEKRDREWLRNALAKQVVLDFDGSLTQEQALVRFDAREGELWTELRDLVLLGVTGGGTSFGGPYLFDLFPPQLNATEFLVITAEDAPVRVKPNSRAEVIARLAYDIVRWDSSFGPVWETVSGEEYVWRKIVTPDGKRGYVSDKYARSPLDYRASFRKIDGKWKLVLMVAGD